MTPAELIAQVRALAASSRSPHAAVTALAPVLAAFVAQAGRRQLPSAACQLGGGARILMNHLDDPFQVVVSLWAAGQRSPIHDHAGAVGAVAALSGATLETKYRIVDQSAGGVRLAREGRLRLCGRVVTPLLPDEGHQLHAMEHAHGDMAATLHVYLAPLPVHQVYQPQADGRHRPRSQRLGLDAVEAWRWWTETPVRTTPASAAWNRRHTDRIGHAISA